MQVCVYSSFISDLFSINWWKHLARRLLSSPPCSPVGTAAMIFHWQRSDTGYKPSTQDTSTANHYFLKTCPIVLHIYIDNRGPNTDPWGPPGVSSACSFLFGETSQKQCASSEHHAYTFNLLREVLEQLRYIPGICWSLWWWPHAAQEGSEHAPLERCHLSK